MTAFGLIQRYSAPARTLGVSSALPSKIALPLPEGAPFSTSSTSARVDSSRRKSDQWIRETSTDSVQRSERRAEKPRPYDIGISISRDSRKLSAVVTGGCGALSTRVTVSDELCSWVTRAVKGVRTTPPRENI